MASTRLKDRACDRCGKQYHPPRSSSKYCSQSCYAAPDSDEKREDTITGDKRLVIANYVGTEPRNPEELMEKCKVDPKQWKLGDNCKIKTYVVTMSGPDDKPISKTMVSVTAPFVRNTEAIEADAVITGLLEKARRESPKPFKLAKPSSEGVVLETGPYDAHFGLQAQGLETGGSNYDLAIATEQWTTAFDKLMSRLQHWKIAELKLIIGNDMAHYDNRNATTFAGTQQDADTRYHKLVQHLNCMIRDQVERVVAEVCPVTIIPVPGNHDPMTTFHLSLALDAYFHRNKHVTVDLSPSPRKYFRFGKVLVGLCHGDAKGGETKFRELGQIMAQERAKDWGETIHREIHGGHYHRESSYDQQGVIHRRVMAMTPACDWSSRQGFGHPVRGIEGFLWDREDGLVDQPRVVIR